jgi:hypothetical protein
VISQPYPGGIKGLKTPIPPSNPQVLNTLKEIWDRNEVGLILDVWWFNFPPAVELRNPTRFKTPIPHSNPQILNTHKEILINNEIRLFLDIWWFNNPASVDLSGPPRFKTPIPIQTLESKKPTKEFGSKTKLD